MHWTPDAHNPLFERQPGAWADEILEQAVVYANGQYYLWYSGWRGELRPDTAVSIGLATSPDGTHWTRHAQNPVITPGAPVPGTICGFWRRMWSSWQTVHC